ncbi:hypothetical protein PAEVO_40260 [Paenibacillus sp. GM2FR]|uniref:hypothetical protein n=1 Tax=Paenibacillus sp. GM2FR TaxID=2059268 RepID=UPI000C27A410|nr:hypothetical protein [Paenibacillus sp. GM2FR]PJN57292.1 hypothetical protein PAEVO_40260 [Paenibacillus sp. GM2FR]
MNNGGFFKELERNTGYPGVGDKYEMTQLLNGASVIITDPETNEEVEIEGVISTSISLNAHLKMPLFCLTQIDSTSLRIVKEEEHSVDCVLDFGGKDIENIIKDFGRYALIVANIGEFQRRIFNAAKESDLNVLQKSVVYEDFNVTSRERILAQRNSDPRYFFFKRKEFAYQREYRVILPGVQTDTSFCLDIGDISDISHIIEVEKFDGMVLKLHK